MCSLHYRMNNFLFEYIDGGAFSETTLRSNSSDLQKIRLRQRVLRDVSNISTETTHNSKKKRDYAKQICYS